MPQNDPVAQQPPSTAVSAAAPAALDQAMRDRELREQLLAILGHDLRNPLQAVYVTSELIAKKSADPALAALAERIKINSRRLTSLLDDALDFARARLGGGIGIRMEPVDDLDTVLRALVQTIQQTHPSHQIEADIGVHRAVRCDPARIRQVVGQLIDNALSYGAPEASVRVTAAATEHELVVEVWNGGPPIPADRLGGIFEPCWRHSAASGRQNLGLGLYLCAQIIQAHGGTLSATSAGNEGTRFSVRVPLNSLPSA